MRTAWTSIALLTTLVAGSWAFAPGPTPADDTCTDGQVPATWPLGPGFEPQLLYDSHGQYLNFSGKPYVHSGIDIAACIGDIAYACEAGRVVYVQYTLGDDANLVVVADSDEVDRGWQYMHLSEVFVKRGDAVLRDQAVGSVARYKAHAGFDHLHLQRMQPGTTSGNWTPSHADAGNPLLLLAARSDTSAPEIQPIDASAAEVDYFSVYADGGTSARAPESIAGIAADVVGNVLELFPGSGPPSCGSTICDKPVATQIMPLRLSFSVFRTEDLPSGAAGVRTIVAEVYNNVIDLGQPILDATAFAENIYRDGSVGTYSDRSFLVDLTHCPTTGVGSFTLNSSGSYLMQLVAEDASGNVAVRELAFELP